jgi:hypothetical protein
MLTMPKNMGARYSPLYFLASVGAGGLATTFFMYLLFWVPHRGRPVPVFEDIMAHLGTASTAAQAATLFAMAAIAFFVYLNIRLLVWNLSEFAKFKKTDAYVNHQKTNAQTQVKAQALALAMTINVSFIFGLVFVPQLWSVVEYLFPLAIIAFLAVGVLAFKNLGQFLSRVLVEGGFDRANNNSFAQLLPAFAFSMIGVGLAAPAAMSTVKATAAVSLVASTFFLVTSVILMSVALVLGVSAMMKHGAAKETAPTLLIVIPIMTVLGILVVRQDHGMHVFFEGHTSNGDTLKFLTMLISIQAVFALLGIMVLRAQSYWSHFVTGTEKSVGSYALVCPGIGFSVLFQFFINKGLVANGIIDKYTAVYWMFTAVAIASQMAMVWLLFKLNNKHFGAEARQALVPAE